jgi:hypothetical protein
MKSRSLHRNLGIAAVASFLVGASSIQCGSTGGSRFGTAGSGASAGTSNGGGSSNGGSTGNSGLGGEILGFDASLVDYSQDSFYQNDPPPMSCDGGGMAPVIMGTPQCPSDKNLPGCPCSTLGATAACWTGLRIDRDHGDCKDGTTTCQTNSESTLGWGPCMGEVLPVAGATSGKEACQCFSNGHWALSNLSPCFYTETDAMNNTTTGAISTLSTTMQCPADFSAAPTTSWSTDTLTADCTGNFNLCYTIKAGNGASPKSTDCTIIQVCSQAYYAVANMVQMWPDLPGWLAPASADDCVNQFTTSGGYGQMSVQGQSDDCENIDKVFQTVTYCPLSCEMANPPAMCATCMAGGGGSF